MLTKCLITDYCWYPYLSQPPPQGPPLSNIYVIISSEPTDKAAEIPVAEGVQETNLKYFDSALVEALDTEDSEAALFQLGGGADHIEEPP